MYMTTDYGGENEFKVLTHLGKATPTIVPQLWDHWTCEGDTYLLIDRFEGTLHHLIYDRHLCLSTQELEALKMTLLHLGRNGHVVHNDLHANNIMYVDERRLQWKVIDFGLSVIYPPHKPDRSVLSKIRSLAWDDKRHAQVKRVVLPSLPAFFNTS